jgi:SAM-dependent methyltransferase
MTSTDPDASYVLGHSSIELRRLSSQAKLVNPFTRRVLQRAGLEHGMRVLDVGSGIGDVAFLVADLVGPEGQVVGFDRSPVPLELARSRAVERSLRNVSFVEGELEALSREGLFNAAVGRYVLQYQEGPAAMLRAVAEQVRPGGLVVFHELDWDGVRSVPPVPTYDRCCRLCREGIASAAEIHMGGKLFSTFLEAGLPAPTLLLEALAGVDEPMRLIAELAESMAPTLERLGLTSAAELEADDLFNAMLSEARATGSFVVTYAQFGAWARLSDLPTAS